MPSPLAQAGATVEPSEYVALAMDEQFTGMWTQRSPLRDADVPYLYRKFYSASRFDSMIDGINREISARLTDIRRPGSSVYNSQVLPPINRFYPFRQFGANGENIRVIADCQGFANQLQNPNFANGSGGWNYEPGWSYTYAGLPVPPGVGYCAMFVGPGSGAVVNLQHIPCTTGTVIAASCWGLGEHGASGTAVLRINFYDASNTYLGSNQSSAVPNNYAWTQVGISAAASFFTNAAYATVDFIVESSTSSTGRWFAWGFTGSPAPGAGTVRDVTGPNTNQILWTKDPAAGKTTFLGVGNVLYAGDGVQTHQMVTSAEGWTANKQWTPGDYIIDPNGNIQMSIGSQTGTIASITVQSNVCTVFLAPGAGIQIAPGVQLTFSGLTTLPALNGTTQTIPAIGGSLQFFFAFTHANLALSSETGTVTTGSGVNSNSPPTWQTGIGAITVDGGQQWECRGGAVQSMGGAGPTTAPTVVQTAAAALFNNWAPNTWYAPSFVIYGAGQLQLLIGPSAPIQTGSSAPSWSTTPGGITTETTGTGSNAQWKCMGSGNWVGGATHAVGDFVVVSYNYATPSGPSPLVTSLFKCTAGGVSSNITPNWTNGLGTITKEPTGSPVTWVNQGDSPPGWPGSNQLLSLDTTILDSSGNLEAIQKIGKSSASAIVWNTNKGGLTGDNTATWLNNGPYSAGNTTAWYWAYSGLNSITGEITNPSPLSQPVVLAPNMHPVIQGSGMPNPPYDSIVLWRTAAGGSTLYYVDQFPNPGTGQTWIYTDTTPDSALNTAMAAPGSANTSSLATPPPSTAVAPEYHCGRIFMIDGSDVIYSGGPDTVVGNGNTSFPPLNYFQLPEQPTRLKSVTMQNGGLIVACVANTYVILGEGTSNNPFLPPKMFMEGVGILSYDCFCMRGSTVYGFSNRSKVFSFDPGNGEIEIGFSIGDQFKLVTTGGTTAALYNPANSYVTWHEQNSPDTGLYVADGTVGWFRWSPIAPPESGSLWSPRAAIVGGTSAVQSVEVSPGTFQLLMGPQTSGPILMRDDAVSGDWTAGAYAGYPSWDVKGSIGLCETGEVAEIVHVAIKSMAVGARPIVSLLLDEIAAGVTVEGRTTAWDTLSLDDGHHEDPPNLEPSITTYSDRYRASSTAETPKCEHFQLKIDYGSQLVADELLKFGIFGAHFKERRQQ